MLQFKSKFAVIVITNDVNQLASVATLPARLLILTGSICSRTYNGKLQEDPWNKKVWSLNMKRNMSVKEVCKS